MSEINSRNKINQKKVQVELTVQELKMLQVAIGHFSQKDLEAEVRKYSFFNQNCIYEEDMGSPRKLFKNLHSLLIEHIKPTTKTLWICVLMNKFGDLITFSKETEDELNDCLKLYFSECKEIKRFSQEVEV